MDFSCKAEDLITTTKMWLLGKGRSWEYRKTKSQGRQTHFNTGCSSFHVERVLHFCI